MCTALYKKQAEENRKKESFLCDKSGKESPVDDVKENNSEEHFELLEWGY